MNNTGTLTLSIEVELGWGFHDMEGGARYFSPQRKQETQFLDRLLALCDEQEIPISFDVVGHLFLSQCDGDHGEGYPEGWFDADPANDIERSPLFYAPDLVKTIDDASVDHEICTHTFSHVMCDEVSATVLEREIETATDLHERAGLNKPRSFVPPRHRPVANKLLRECGVETVRVADFEKSHPENPVRQYVSKFVSPVPITEPRVNGEVLETYCSPHPTLTAPFLPTGQAPSHPAYRVMPASLRRRIHTHHLKDSLERTIDRNSYVHHWTHLHNLANSQQWRPIKSFLSFAADRRAAGKCRIRTMDQLKQ